MARSSEDIGTVVDQELLTDMQIQDFQKYVRRCSSCYDARKCLKMTVDGDSLSMYDR